MHRTIIVAVIGLLANGVVMAEGLFLNSHNTSSDRYVILDETEKVAFLYLTEKGSQKPIKDAIAYMRVVPPNKVDWKEMAQKGKPPVLSAEYASENAVISNANENQFDFEWSANGESAVLLFQGVPIALVSSSKEIGYSKAVSKVNKLTNPWSQETYEELFSQ